MATASPTPMGPGSHFTSLGRRTSARQALRRPPSRQQMSRSESNPVPGSVVATREPKSQSQQYSAAHDSSDDEIPGPVKLSAYTKALLNGGQGSEASSAHPSMLNDRPSSPARPASRVMTRRSGLNASTSSATEEKQVRDREPRRHVRAGSAQLPSSRPTSPVRSRESSPAPRKRVVRLSNTPMGGSLAAGGGLNHRLRRSLSTTATAQRKGPESRDRADEKSQQQQQQQPQQPQQPQPSKQEELPADVNTPVLPVRTVRIVVGSSGQKARSGNSSGISLKRSVGHSDQDVPQDPATVDRPPPGTNQGSVSRYGGTARKDDGAPQSSLRMKRVVTKVPGSFLSGPARRGKRRQSEEDAEDQGDGEALVSSQERGSQQPQEQDAADNPASFVAASYRDFAATGSPVSAKDSARAAIRNKVSNANIGEANDWVFENVEVKVPAYKPVAPPVNLPSTHDKENEVPSSFKRSKPQSAVFIEPDVVKPARPLNMDIRPSQPPSHVSPERKVLAMKSHNTPHRPAPPPPPKMSVVETATKPAGAAAAAPIGKKRAILLRVNDRTYTRIDCLGRGGSGKVYRVTAENGSMYALKRVSIENADETMVKGLKGEIDLLKRLTGVDRVIQLYDWELNEEKKMISLLMEMGELDLHSLFKSRLGSEGHKLDLVFVKFIWKEMLECLASVHAKDIIHSDLKPMNFVLVKGRLKLIDFGIANAIQTDETVNVHRENQVGTPSFMSPESLMDSNQYAFTVANNGRFCVPPPMQHRKKLTKLGKPSDVWSLGCILYQMVYGDTPFAHIPNQMNRCQAIINWNHVIEFPEMVGGVRVPPSLIRTMKRCLNREQKERPTCEELLSSTDPFLYPQEFNPDVFGVGEGKALPITEELLGRIIQSVVQRCKERPPTDGEVLSAWPMAYWASIKKTVGANQLRP